MLPTFLTCDSLRALRLRRYPDGVRPSQSGHLPDSPARPCVPGKVYGLIDPLLIEFGAAPSWDRP
jgi:hypothetical protein